ncbi:hypothetical protein DITRI_Ditri03aG0159300 [Diplodiscus trichospermus]
MAKILVTEEVRSRQEQRRPNHMRRPSVLPDLNLLLVPDQSPTNRPDENGSIPTDSSDSKSSSDGEIDEGYGGNEDSQDEDEELRREIQAIREELQALQKKLGSVPKTLILEIINKA